MVVLAAGWQGVREAFAFEQPLLASIPTAYAHTHSWQPPPMCELAD